MSFGSSAMSAWSNIYQSYVDRTRTITQWQHAYHNNSQFSVHSTNSIPTSVDLSGVIIDDISDDPPKPMRAAREEPTLMEVWRD